MQGIYNFQYWDDAAAIRERINTAKHAVVVGGSYIAYELAEAYRHHGLAVTWLIRGPRFLRRVLDEDGGALVDDIARAAGVDIVYGGEVAGGPQQGRSGVRRDDDHRRVTSAATSSASGSASR